MQDKADKIISLSAADRLISAHDGDVALLYIYVRRTGCTDTEKAAGDLCRTMQEIKSAEEKLLRMGLLSSALNSTVTSGDEPPQYTAADLTRRAQEDPEFSVILAEAKNVMGKPINTNDMRILLWIKDCLGLPTDVVFMLLHYCRELCERLYGAGRNPTVKFIEQEAGRWAKREISNIDLAEEYIRRDRERHERTEQLKKLLGINRDLTPTERKYVSSWAQMGFDDEVITLALDRTVTQTGSLRWPYMDKILQSWSEKRLFTVEDIEAKDSHSPKRKPGEPGSETPVDLNRLKDILNNI